LEEWDVTRVVTYLSHGEQPPFFEYFMTVLPIEGKSRLG